MALKDTLNTVYRVPSKAVQKERELPKPSVALPKVPGPAPFLDIPAVTDDFLKTWYNSPERNLGQGRHQGVFHPSSGLHPEAHACERLTVFDLLCAEVSETHISPMLSKILENGTNRHKGLNELFGKLAEKKYKGVEKFEHDIPAVHPRLPLLGEADGRLWYGGGHRVVMDFKTINTKNFGTTCNPSLKHKLQVNTYCGLLGERMGYVLYENKDNQKWSVPANDYYTPFDPKLYAEVEDYCLGILRRIANEEIPEFDQKECDDGYTFCAYSKVCSAHRDGRMTFQQIDRRSEKLKHRHLEVIQ